MTEILRKGAREMLCKTSESELADYFAAHRDRLVVSNGHATDREVQTGLAAVTVKQPRVDGKRADEVDNRIRFTRHILPAYMRRTKSI